MNEFPLTLLFTVFALVLVLVLAWFAIRLLAKMGGGQMSNSRIKLTHTLPLGARERIVLVECDGKSYLLGVTGHGISVIDQSKVNESSSAVDKLSQ